MTETNKKKHAVQGGLAVIGAGYGRTGTASMQQALNLLGFGPCYHMFEVSKSSSRIEQWDRVGLLSDDDTSGVDWDDIFDGYQSAVDFPVAPYYKELYEKYPHAKVILTVRDPEKWWDSYKETIGPSTPFWRFVFTVTFVRNFYWDRMTGNCVYKKIAGTRAKARHKEFTIAGFNAHNAEVEATIPSDKLLVFEVKQGWEPLCKFLGCPVPKDAPFPRTNDTAHFKERIALRKRQALAILFAEVTMVIGGWVWLHGVRLGPPGLRRGRVSFVSNFSVLNYELVISCREVLGRCNDRLQGSARG